MNKEEALQLIVIDDSSNDAETVSNMLRNAGQVVHTISVEDDEDLREAIKSQACDMVLSKPEVPLFSALDAINLLRQLGQDLPVIILNQKSTDLDVELLKAGARDYVSLEQPERLAHVLLREQADIRTRRRCTHIEKSLEETNIRAQGLVDSSRDAIAYVHEGMHIYANDSYAKIFGHTDVIELEGTPIMDMINADDHAKFKEYLRSYLKGKTQTDTLEITGLKLGGGSFAITMEFSPANFEGEVCIQIIIRDQSSNKELEQKLNELSKQDLVTGTYNRQFFMENLAAVAGKDAMQGVVLYIAPDNFDDIREQAGLSGRDLVIAEFAHLLKPLLPDENSVLSRYESHMFAALLPDTDTKQAEETAATIVKAVEEHVFDTGNGTVNISCSIGIAEYNEAIENPQDVVTRAHKAQQKVRDSGGNNYDV
ncbi:diguanylate cyclase, partial [Candidatus Pacearchaeota archaeon]|nr:diguanylate cyclase [Candidatus Pacearchaeota archaeon]